MRQQPTIVDERRTRLSVSLLGEGEGRVNRWDEIRARARAARALCGATDGTLPTALLQAAHAATGVQWGALPAYDPGLFGAQGVYNAECGYILVSAALPPARQYFVVAHEYAHHWLGHGSALSKNPDPETSDALSDGPDRVEGYTPFALAERGADVFALELLLPTDALRRAYLAGETPGQIADRAGLPERAVLRQLSRALLLPPPADTPPDVSAPLVLDASQQAAAHAPRGPVFVEAGPGTGKTRALVGRIAHVLAAGIVPEEVLALTFSNRAADEVRERVARVHPRGGIAFVGRHVPRLRARSAAAVGRAHRVAAGVRCSRSRCCPPRLRVRRAIAYP